MFNVKCYDRFLHKCKKEVEVRFCYERVCSESTKHFENPCFQGDQPHVKLQNAGLRWRCLRIRRHYLGIYVCCYRLHIPNTDIMKDPRDLSEDGPGGHGIEKTSNHINLGLLETKSGLSFLYIPVTTIIICSLLPVVC